MNQQEDERGDDEQERDGMHATMGHEPEHGGQLT
jgi:hypothetical protein